VVRVVLALLAIGVCLLLMQSAARIGFSRLLSRYAIGANSLAAADQAIQLTPSDAEAHRARATVLNRLHRPAEARGSLETATSLRSQHATLWLELGATREELGDTEAALAAFDQAVRYAPRYAETHWQRGNLLLRMGRHDEAFADLRQAAVSNRKFFPALIDLAFGLTGGDGWRMAKLLQINRDEDRLELLRYLARKGRGGDVVAQLGFFQSYIVWGENRKELVRLLFAAKAYGAAFHLRKGVEPLPTGELFDGGFEEPLVVNNPDFGWVVSSGPAKPKLAIDVAERFAGDKSLQVSFSGEWDTSTPLLSQTLVLETGRYRISFALKTKDLVTGGPPRIVLTDAMNEQILAASETFPQSTGSWRQFTVEFRAVADDEAAVVISLKRENCASLPCPIFGTLWLDEFVLEKLESDVN
jgi:tetratricopeptide (TPR) repeat protein